jgi:Nickel responsive protein SCO4226-like
MREFIAEQYLSGSDTGAAHSGAEAARLAAEQLCREGAPVQFVRSIFIPEDETCLYIYEADSVETVRAAIARAGLRFEHVAEALSDSGAKRSLT